MKSKARRLIIKNAWVALLLLLLGTASSCVGSLPKERLSWQDQLIRVQQAMAEVDSNAKIYRVNASMFYDAMNRLEKNDQNGPLPIMQISFSFDGTSPGKQHKLSYYDVMTEPLSVDTYTIEPKPFDSSQLELAQLPTLLPIGPFEICQSTLDAAKKLLKTEPTKINCSMMLIPNGPEPEEFGIPAVWFVTLYIYEGKKVSEQIDIWINPTTGKQLKLVRRCSATEKTACDVLEPTSRP